MQTSEKFCLKWNDFKENVNTAFKDLRMDNEFTDVTLACEDGHQIEAHKVILSVSSPFFHNLLKINKRAHPLIYMRGMNSEDLLSIVDFLYCGEANICQDNLDKFLKIAKELQLKGLNGGEGRSGEGGAYDSNSLKQTYNHTVSDIFSQKMNDTLQTQSHYEDQKNYSMAVSLQKHESSGDLNELDGKIQTMIGRGENMMNIGTKRMIKAYVCQVCGKEGALTTIRDHIEANHLDGICIPCNVCEKSFRSRHSLRMHNSRSHTNDI